MSVNGPADSSSSGDSVNSQDLVPLAVSTIGLAIMLGTAIMAVFLLFNRSMVETLPVTPSAQPDVNQPAATMLMVGVMATLLVPMLTAWGLLAPITVLYRRFGFAMVSGLGALGVSLVAVPAYEIMGIRGLWGLLAASSLAGLMFALKVRAQRSPR